MSELKNNWSFPSEHNHDTHFRYEPSKWWKNVTQKIETKCFFQFKIIIYALVSFFSFI